MSHSATKRVVVKPLLKPSVIITFLCLLAFLLPTLAAGPENPDLDFRYHDKPIHPLLIKQFEPWVSDARPPITVELNLTAAWDSNQYAAGFNTDSNGMVSVSLPEGGTYSYRHLGKLRGGIHVLRTFSSEGGSGVFEAILFVRFQTRLAYMAEGLKQAQQTFIQEVRRFPLGDRDEAEVLVRADNVLVGKSRYRPEPVNLKFWKDDSQADKNEPD